MKVMSILFFLAMSLSTMAEINISNHQFSDVAKIRLTGSEAQNLYDQLVVKRTPKHRCIESRRAGAQGTSSICVEYADEPYKFIKNFTGLSCSETINPKNYECEFSASSFSKLIDGKGALFSNSSGENLSNSAQKYFSHLPNSTFRTKNQNLKIKCVTLVTDRYFDCFITIDVNDSRTSLKIGNRLKIAGKKLLGGSIRRQYVESSEQFAVTKELAQIITSPVRSIVSDRPSDLSFTIAFRELNDTFLHPIFYNLTGKLVKIEKRSSQFRDRKNDTILIFDLDKTFIRKLSKSLPLTLENIQKLNMVFGSSKKINYKNKIIFKVVRNKLTAKLEARLY